MPKAPISILGSYNVTKSPISLKELIASDTEMRQEVLYVCAIHGDGMILAKFTCM